MTELSGHGKSVFEKWIGQLSDYLDPNDPSQAIRWLKGAFDRGVRFNAELPTSQMIAERIGSAYGKQSDPELSSEPPNRRSYNPDFAAWLIVSGLNALEVSSMHAYATFARDAKMYLNE